MWHLLFSRTRVKKSNEPGHSMSYKITCSISGDSDQAAHLRRLIRVFTVRLKTVWTLGYTQCAPRRLIFAGGRTLHPLYNMVSYKTVLDITRFKDGAEKCVDYIKK